MRNAPPICKSSKTVRSSFLTIWTTPTAAAEWEAFVRWHKRNDARLVFYGPESLHSGAYARALALLD